MKSLSAFLNPGNPENEKHAISERFKDESGKPVKWELRRLMTKELQIISKQCENKDKKGITHFDKTSYQNRILCNAVVFPDLKNTELQGSYNVFGEEDLLVEMLTPGEYAELRNKVFGICGLDEDINEDIEEAKN